MTDANPRDLIRRLTDALNDLSQHLEAESPAPAVQNAHKAWKEARAYLAQPEQEGLTDRKLEELADDYMVMDGSNGTMHLEHLDFARAAIAADRALCARPAIKPVPVSEPPKPEDCDAEGRCWWGRPSEELCNSDWFLATRAEVDEFCDAWPPIVFLPHWALPVPTKAS